MTIPPSQAIESFHCAATAARFAAAYEALLGKWPVAYQSLLIPTQLGSTHVLVSGPADAPALVLLHGMRATALVWRANVAGLSHHFRVYAVDVIGQGGRSVSQRRIRKREDYARWLCEVFDRLNIGRAAVVGNSYGGFLALNQASLAPERVDRVVLINPAGVFVTVLPLAFKFGWAWLLRSLPLRPRQPADIARYLGRNVRLRPDEMEWASMIAVATASNSARRNLIVPTVFSTAELRAIHAPTLLLMGDNDLLYDPMATLRKATQRMPALHTQVLPGAHHIAAMSKPAEANQHILRFLGIDGM